MSGFSLIEVMVAMVIGMLGIIVMLQVMALFEGQKRSTTGGSDAQNTGAIELYQLQRNLHQSGYGTSALLSLGCGLTLPNGANLTSLAPVTINDPLITGQDPGTDTLLIVYSESNSSTEGNSFTGLAVGNSYPLQNPASFQAGDFVYAMPKVRPAPCNLTMDTVASVSTTVNVTNGSGFALAKDSQLFNLGQSVRVLAYAVRNGSLTECDYMINDCANNGAGIWIPIADSIVSLKAQYGRDTNAPMTGIVDTYDGLTPTIASPTLACDWLRISSIRIALVTSNNQFNKEDVTTVAPVWMGSATDPIVLTTKPNWTKYRYKTFQTIVPLRNITWMLIQGANGLC
jgi:type IV pilus assembly protein PilW